MEEYATPIGGLKVDTEINTELANSGLFQWMSQENDEAEHSIEMQLPFIRQVF